MTITFDITRNTTMTANSSVSVRASVSSVDSSETDFVSKLISEVEQFTYRYANRKEKLQ